MDWIALYVICMNIMVLQARHDLNIRKLIEIIKRRNLMHQYKSMLAAPRYPEDLPEAESILPGHTLIRPSNKMLKSAVKYPLRDSGALVYGNLDNIGIANDKIERVMYSNFRRSDDLLAALKKTVQNLKKKQRRYSKHQFIPILGAPKYPEDLPEAEPILPGHTLLRPAKGMLKSAVKYPLRDQSGSLVYGNVANIGIANDKQERVMYSDFRKSNKLLTQLANSIRDYYTKTDDNPLIVVKPFGHRKKSVLELAAGHSEEENHAREVIDLLDPERNFFERNTDLRRKIKSKKSRSKSKFRKRSNEESETSTSDSSSESSDERNPGNPYTIHKDKYKQNWMWNHNMDGDHMNINPYAPQFSNAGPSGGDLFFGRKWWYFNQDDYKPMG